MWSEYETSDALFHIDVAVTGLIRSSMELLEPVPSLKIEREQQTVMISGGSPQWHKSSHDCKSVYGGYGCNRSDGSGSGCRNGSGDASLLVDCGSGGVALEVDGPQHFMSNDAGEEIAY